MLSAGESSSGIIASILIWGQSIGTSTSSPRFSVAVYFIIISCIFPLSFYAFWHLKYKLDNKFFDKTEDWIHTASNQDLQSETISAHILSTSVVKKNIIISSKDDDEQSKLLPSSVVNENSSRKDSSPNTQLIIFISSIFIQKFKNLKKKNCYQCPKK